MEKGVCVCWWGRGASSYRHRRPDRRPRRPPAFAVACPSAQRAVLSTARPTAAPDPPAPRLPPGPSAPPERPHDAAIANERDERTEARDSYQLRLPRVTGPVVGQRPSQLRTVQL